MKAKLEVNGIERLYPQKISDLESLIVFMMAEMNSEGENIVGVKVDGKLYSEAYEHQSRKIDLKNVKHVEIDTQSNESMAHDFLKQAPEIIEGLKHALVVTSDLLGDPEREQNGYDMLAMSLATIRTLKSHLEAVWNILDDKYYPSESASFWEKINNLADRIVAAQEGRNALLIGELLSGEMVPLLEDWKQDIQGSERLISLTPGLEGMNNPSKETAPSFQETIRLETQV